MSKSQILVNKKPFLARVEQQEAFRVAWREVCDAPEGESLPYVFLLYGAGGIGKSTLAARYREIALSEPPFGGKMHCLWLDWQDEYWLDHRLRVGREHIEVEAVFDRLHTVAVGLGWGEHFERYEELLGRKLAEREAVAVLEMRGERDELAPLRDASPTALANVMRAATGMIMSGQQVATRFREMGIRVDAEQAAGLLTKAETRLRAKLTPERFEMFLNPYEQLALALADGLRRVAQVQPLLVVLDTYEIVDQADRWLRLVMKAAGPHLLWVIAARQDAGGYANDFPRRLLAVNMPIFFKTHIRAYFAAHVPERALDDVALEAISHATHGIPLAIREAAAIWATGQPLTAIVGDTTEDTPRQQIVPKITERYLLHGVSEERDRQALYILALAGRDQALLRTLLAQDKPNFELMLYLRDLERRYACLYREEARLHDDVAAFLRETLQTRLRQAPWVEALLEQVTSILRERVEALEQNLLTIEERCQDEAWIKAVQDELYYLFWQDEEAGWRAFAPRIVEALAYNHKLWYGLLEVAQAWSNTLSTHGQKRLNVLQQAAQGAATIEDEAALLKELDELAKREWLAGPDEAERRAILALRHGQLLVKRQLYDRALDLYEQVERGLPKKGVRLREKLAEALYELTAEWIWPSNWPQGFCPAKAKPILTKLIEWFPQKQGAWYRLGYVHGKGDEAIAAYQQAIELDPTDAYAQQGLANAYHIMEQYDEAIAAYGQASKVDPTDAHTYARLAKLYCDQERYDDAIAAYQQAIQLNKTNSFYYRYLADLYRDQERYDTAIALYQQAIEVDPKNEHWYYSGLGSLYGTLPSVDSAIAVYQQASKFDPTDADYHNGLGHLYHAMKQYDEAIAAYQQAIQLDPTAARYHYHLAKLYRDQNRKDDAIAAYEQAIQLDPTAASYHNSLAHLYREQKRNDKAMAAYQQAIKLNPTHGRYHDDLGDLYRKLRRYDDAIAAYEQANQFGLTLSSDYNRLGFLCRFQEQNDKAIVAYEQFSRLDPTSAVGYNNLGDLYHKQERYNDAIAAYQQAIEVDPEDANYHALANLYCEQERYDDAIATYQQAIQFNPTSAHAHNHLAHLYRDQERVDSAIAAYQRAIQVNPTSAVAYNNLADLYRDQGRYDDAIATYQQALQVKPTNYYAHNNLANLYREQERYDDAIDVYEEAIELDPTGDDYYHAFANLYREQGIPIYPTSALAYNRLGKLYRDQGRYDDAIAAYQRAIKLRPTNPYYHNSLANLYRDQGRYDDAIAAQQRAIELRPTNSYWHNSLANLYRDQGRYDDAIAAHQRAIELDPTNPYFQNELAELYRSLGRHNEGQPSTLPTS